MKFLPAITRFGLFFALAFASLTAVAGEVRVLADVPYLAATRTEKLDIYLPAREAGAPLAPAAVWIHGLKGDKGERRGREICTTLAAAGYVAVSINHGSDRDFATNPLDCKNAVRFLRAHAGDYGIDPDRIAIMGGSMGGYYALLVGFTAGRLDLEPTEPYPGVSSAVRAVVDFYGPMGPPMRSIPEFVTADGPPVLVLHGAADNKVPPSESERLVAALQAKGVPHDYILLPGIGHTFRLTATWDNQPLPQDLTPVLLDFLAKHLAPRTTAPAQP